VRVAEEKGGGSGKGQSGARQSSEGGSGEVRVSGCRDGPAGDLSEV
jgi:hypothetical protein